LSANPVLLLLFPPPPSLLREKVRPPFKLSPDLTISLHLFSDGPPYRWRPAIHPMSLLQEFADRLLCWIHDVPSAFPPLEEDTETMDIHFSHPPVVTRSLSPPFFFAHANESPRRTSFTEEASCGTFTRCLPNLFLPRRISPIASSSPHLLGRNA